MTEILRTEGLSRYFGAVTAAEDINVTISEGEIVGVIGSNGAGKTTFINMVTGYLPPSQGSIAFDGAPIKGLGPRKLMRKGLTRSFQIPQLFLELPVIDNLAIALAAAEQRQFQMIRPVRTDRKSTRLNSSDAGAGLRQRCRDQGRSGGRGAGRCPGAGAGHRQATQDTRTRGRHLT